MSTLEMTDKQELDKQTQKKNKVWLIVLVAVILLLMLSSYGLFNNFWDPAESAKTISH